MAGSTRGRKIFPETGNTAGVGTAPTPPSHVTIASERQQKFGCGQRPLLPPCAKSRGSFPLSLLSSASTEAKGQPLLRLVTHPTSDLDFNAKTGLHGVRHHFFPFRVTPPGRDLKAGVGSWRVFRRDCLFFLPLSPVSPIFSFFSLLFVTRLAQSLCSPIRRLVFIAIFFLSLSPFCIVGLVARWRVTDPGPSNFLPVVLVSIRPLPLFFTRFRGYSVNDHRGNLKITRPDLRSKRSPVKGLRWKFHRRTGVSITGTNQNIKI